MKIVKGNVNDRYVTPSWKIREKLREEEGRDEVKTKS